MHASRRPLAGVAAQEFESRFEEPAALVLWMQRKGVARGTIARRAAGREAPPPPPPSPPFYPPRARTVGYLDAGIGLAPYGSPSNNLAPGFDARLGLSGPPFSDNWAFAQLDISWWDSRAGQLEREFTAIGLDAGPLLRISSALDIAIGAGLQATDLVVTSFSYGSQPVWVRNWRVVPGAIVSIRFMTVIRSFRLHMTIEGRVSYGAFDSVIVTPAEHGPAQF